MAIIIPYSNTCPIFAFNSFAITTDQDVVVKPCVTDNAVTIGNPSFSGDTFARLAIVKQVE